MTVARQGRRARRVLTALTALGMSAVLAGCGAGASPAAGGTAPAPAVEPIAATQDADLVMIIRHGEKPEDDALGVDANGNPDDASMTEEGWARARGLRDLFAPATGAPRAGLARPMRIYAAGENEDGRGQRTRETVQPLAERLGVPVETRFGKGEEQELVEHILAEPGPTLISWQHSEIPDITEAFGTVSPEPPSQWPDDRYDVIWTLQSTAVGWHFTQQPELVLPQDRASVIPG